MNNSENQTEQTDTNAPNVGPNVGPNFIPHDSSTRGYSVQNSFYDSPYNMDFEYGYLNLMFNIFTFTARTQEMFQSLESNLSGIIELQNERRRLDYESRQTRETRETRENNQNPFLNIRQPSTQTNAQTTTQPAQGTRQNIFSNTGASDNLNYLLGRRNIYDTSNNILFSFLPRNVLLNPVTLPEGIGAGLGVGLGAGAGAGAGANANRTTRRNRNGLTIQEIEENTEIITYGSITTRQTLNTECPISRDSFNENSVVLRLKECGHCFVPFRMMTWLESHSTCPLCRANIIPEVVSGAGASVASPDTTFTNIINNIRNSTNLDNLSIDNVNDDSVVFSFDLPRPTNYNEGREFTNNYLSSLSQIFSNLNRNTAASAVAAAAVDTDATTDASANPTDSNSETNDYEEVD